MGQRLAAYYPAISKHYREMCISMHHAIASRFMLPALAGSAAALSYFIGLSRDLSWSKLGADGGELITASMTLGVAHPPGYPTYILAGKLFSLLPIGGTVAYRYNIFSAVSMSLAVAFTAAMIGRSANQENLKSLGKQLPYLAAALIFAFIPLVWSQAITAEVYALNLAVLAALLWELMKRDGRGRPPVIGILMGLAVTTHLTSLLMFPLVILYLKRKSVVSFTVGLLTGMLPLIVLPVLGSGSSPIIWGDPTTFSGWYWLVSARLYQPNLDPLLPTGWATAGIILLTLMIILFFRFIRRGAAHENCERYREPALLTTAGLYFIFASIYQTNDAIVLTLPGLLCLALVLGRYVQKLGNAALILPLFLLAINLFTGNSFDDNTPRMRGEQILSLIPEGAIVLTKDERTLFSLWYLQHVEAVRTDLIIGDRNMLQFEWYRRRFLERYPSLENLADYDIDGFIRENSPERPVCTVEMDQPHLINCSSG